MNTQLIIFMYLVVLRLSTISRKWKSGVDQCYMFSIESSDLGCSVESFENPVFPKESHWNHIKPTVDPSCTFKSWYWWMSVGCNCYVDGAVGVLNRNLLWVHVPHKCALFWNLVRSHSSFWHLIKDTNISHKLSHVIIGPSGVMLVYSIFHSVLYSHMHVL